MAAFSLATARNNAGTRWYIVVFLATSTFLLGILLGGHGSQHSIVAWAAAAASGGHVEEQAPEQPKCGGFMRSSFCMEYTRVCFDQGVVVSFDEAHSPLNKSAVPVPELDITNVKYNWAALSGDNGDRWATFLHKGLSYRLASKLEASPDLQHPQFSNCTVPVILWPHHVHTFGDVVYRLVARTWRQQHDGEMSPNNTIVVGTPGGEALQPFIPELLAPFTPYEVVSFAQFSARNVPPDAVVKHTAEGRQVRCFRTAYMCKYDDGGDFATYDAMQAVYRYYEPRLPAPGVTWDSDGDELFRVLIANRPGEVRNFLNLEQLDKECNDFSEWKLPPGSPITRVQCRVYNMTDNQRNMATVRMADTIIVVHGSGGINWMYTREGTALLEIRPFQFHAKLGYWADFFYKQVSDRIEHRLLWFALNVEDKELHQKTKLELEGVGETGAWLRDRHVTLPFPAVREMLERIMSANRTTQTYIEKILPMGLYHVDLVPGGELKEVWCHHDDCKQRQAAYDKFAEQRTKDDG